jgi:mono/diheme cytochrome c family protein
MKRYRTILLITPLLLAGCGGGGGTTGSDVPTEAHEGTEGTQGTTGEVVLPTSTAGRLLASNCFQCHGTNGTGGFERIAGGEAGEIWEFRTKTASADIMAAHAQGYTEAQLQALVGYLNQIR